ncbi:uncharacterized protein PGTG_01313 [Puccinia graminis f. sp. tritici CRL 75-36-700-3]|uniref:Uncharacterized protein n=1 Tax=Puccinia graminis f. sp. tritici (strain CRL 75-36-700-3 / race SCCL) TaxID=418459 RepID=E3JVA7_PUCGT|nr:uncharacterized protein PGTG_01313 [Puccinia graminis f. sp. tritici CRL 75-36-700-3]EFP75982.2 hypothetical protein PGTG_01313 [Puccinia graminis f. sp. tritici CRL 75-36-700-3]
MQTATIVAKRMVKNPTKRFRPVSAFAEASGKGALEIGSLNSVRDELGRGALSVTPSVLAVMVICSGTLVGVGEAERSEVWVVTGVGEAVGTCEEVEVTVDAMEELAEEGDAVPVAWALGVEVNEVVVEGVPVDW